MLDAQDQRTGFQEKFVHDDALRFQAATNMAKRAGAILGQKLGQSEHEAMSLGDFLLRADLTEPGDADLHQAIKEVAESFSVDLTDPEISDIIALARSQATHPPAPTDTNHQP